MTSVKGQGSSHRKGKEIPSNDPTTKDVGEEAPHSESEHFDEEERCHDSDSECAPLIDPWYDTNTHFPKVNEYAPPPQGRVLTPYFATHI